MLMSLTTSGIVCFYHYVYLVKRFGIAFFTHQFRKKGNIFNVFRFLVTIAVLLFREANAECIRFSVNQIYTQHI